MKRLIKATSYLMMANLSEMVYRFGRTKAIAVLIGPAGTGFLAQIGFFLELLRVAGGFGTRRAVVRQIGELRQQPGTLQTDQYGKILSSAAALQLALSLTISTGVSFFARSISVGLFHDPQYAGYVIATAWILPVASLSMLMGSVVKAHLIFKGFAKGTIASNAVLLILAPLLVWKFRYSGGIASLYFFYGLPMAAYVFVCVNHKLFRLSRSVDFRLIREMISDGANNFYQLMFSNLIRVLIASWITERLGLDHMGIYQSVLTLTSVYLAIPIQSMSGYTVPAIAGAKDNAEIGKAVNDSFRLMLLILAPVIVFIVIFPEFVLDLMYSADFVAAAPVLRWQLIGVLFEIVNFSLGSALAAKGKYKILYVTSTVHSLLYIGLSWVFFHSHGLTGLAWGYTTATAVITVILVAANRHYFRIHVNAENTGLVLRIVLWVAIAYSTAWVDAWYFHVAAFLSGVYFFAASLTAGEWTYLKGAARKRLARFRGRDARV